MPKMNTGLTEAQVLEARQLYGSNELTRRKRRSFLAAFLASFADPIIKILLVALFVNILFMFRNADIYETIGIALAVLLATFVSTLSEYGSESAFDKLQEEISQIRCRALRSGRLCEIPVGEVVVGECVYLQAGERVPADGVLIQGELGVDQSALNGESEESRKSAAELGIARVHGDEAYGFLDKARLFRGSVVCSGEGMLRVESVGDATFYGRLALEVQEDTLPSPLKQRLADLANTICRIGYVCALIVTLATIFNAIVADNNYDIAQISTYISNHNQVLRDVLRALTLGITIIVMAVPEGLPMMITVVLSSNMKKMLRDNVLVRKLVGVETAGSLNILFTDKTGTLTQGALETSFVLDAQGRMLESLEELRKCEQLYKYFRLNCLFNNGAQLGRSDKSGVAGKFKAGSHMRAVGGNSTDRALLEFVKNDVSDIAGWRKLATVPFDSVRKFSVAYVAAPENKQNFWGHASGTMSSSLGLVKGAPEAVLARCTNALERDGVPLRLASTQRLALEVDRHCREGVRVIALALSNASADRGEDVGSLTLIGFVGIRDELRAEAEEAVAKIRRAGIQTVMITGDNAQTAVAIARKAGILNHEDVWDSPRGGATCAIGAVITSAEMANLSDEELGKRLAELRVVARALPADKSRLVRLAQERGLVAGMTGDGVNDAPALKRADVGFAMGEGTEVAKEAGDIVILDNNISSIAKAILYGRTIFKSIRKFIVFQLTVNICAVGVSVIGPFIGVDAPVTIVQMLWINIIMDTLGGLAFAGEAPLDEYMDEPPKKRSERIINSYMYNQMLITGMYTVALCLAFISMPWFLHFFRGDRTILMSAFFALFIFAGVFNSFNARTNRLNLFAYIGRNRGFIIIMALVSLIQLSMVYFGGALFRAASLLPRELALVIALASTVVIADAVRKLLLRAASTTGVI